MQESEVYQPVWKKYVPVIAMKLKQAIRKNEPASFNVYKPDFQNVTKRKKTVFDFTLEIRDGQVKNTLSLPEVAKDLFKVLKQDVALSQLINNGRVTFILNSDFILTLHKGASVIEAADSVASE
jgi:hypothetical protein